jgi:hypothetical protein
MPLILIIVDYKQKIIALLEDPPYKRLARDPTESTKGKTTLLLKKSTHRRYLLTTASDRTRSPRLYGLPTKHKEGSIWDPLLATLALLPTCAWQDLCLAGLLSQLIGNSAHHVKNSFQNSDAGKSPESKSTTNTAHILQLMCRITLLLRTPRTVACRKSLLNISTMTTKFSPGFEAEEYLVLSTFIKINGLGKVGCIQWNVTSNFKTSQIEDNSCCR